MNDYVLSLALEHGLINTDQHHAVVAMLTSNPNLPAVELLHEQQLINDAQRAWFQEAIAAARQTPAPNTTHLHDYLQSAHEAHASDLHLSPDAAPTIRIDGQLQPLWDNATPLPAAETERLARAFLTPAQTQRVEETGGIEFGGDLGDHVRFRASVVRQRRGWTMAVRLLHARPPFLEDLGLPDIVRTFTGFKNGLVLITGPVGSGKSTTLAALVEQINRDRREHIITLENPIEYLFEPKGCQITQREIGLHTESHATGLRAALREDPDIILIDELRDLETIQLAVTAAETGHLVLGTLHTPTAPRTIDRLLDVFPPAQQPQIRAMLADSIRGIVCQQLIPRANGPGRVLAAEVMTQHPAISTLIREAKTYLLPGILQTNRPRGMQTMEDAVQHLTQSGAIK